MENNFNPTKHLLKAKKLKFISFIPAFFLVGIALVLQNYSFVRISDVLTFIGIAVFVYNLIRYRVGQVFERNIGKGIVSPVNGKVVAIEKFEKHTEVRIKKSISNKCDFRYFNEDAVIKVNEMSDSTGNVLFVVESGKVIPLDDDVQGTKSFLAGLLPTSALVKAQFAKKLKIKVEVGSKLISGETTLAE